MKIVPEVEGASIQFQEAFGSVQLYARDREKYPAPKGFVPEIATVQLSVQLQKGTPEKRHSGEAAQPAVPLAAAGEAAGELGLRQLGAPKERSP